MSASPTILNAYDMLCNIIYGFCYSGLGLWLYVVGELWSLMCAAHLGSALTCTIASWTVFGCSMLYVVILFCVMMFVSCLCDVLFIYGGSYICAVTLLCLFMCLSGVCVCSMLCVVVTMLLYYLCHACCDDVLCVWCVCIDLRTYVCVRLCLLMCLSGCWVVAVV